MASEVKADKLSPSSGTALQLGDASDTITVPTGATFTITDGLGVAGGGTGLTSLTAGDILYATGTTTLAKLAKGTAEQVLAMNTGATAPDWGSVDLTVLPTITVAKGGTNLSSFTAGDILYATGTTTLARLAKGSGSDTLKMNSGATAPEWVTVAAASSDYEKLETQTISSAVATVTFDGNFTSDYDFYRLYVTNWSGAAAARIKMQFRASDTALTANSYRSAGFSSYYDGTTKSLDGQKGGDWDTASVHLSWGDSLEESADAGGWNGTIDFYQPLNAATFPNFLTDGYGTANGYYAQWERSGGYYNVATAISGFNLFWDGQDSDSGTFTLFGVKK